MKNHERLRMQDRQVAAIKNEVEYVRVQPPAEPHRNEPLSSEKMSEKMRAENLKAWFGSLEALKGVTLPIPDRRVTAIIGPSGCGKSTFVRCLNRMHEVVLGTRVEGKVLLEGEDIYGDSVNPVRVRQRIGMVFQKANPFPTMSIRDNVLAGMYLQGRRSNDMDGMVEKALHQAALWNEVKDILGRSGTSLSGGQQQRLCIARALALEPDVLLMDEPSSALDPISTAKIEELIYDLKKEYTIVIVTHNMQQAARVSDQTAFFLSGNLVEFNDTKLLFTKPSRSETEDYITGRFG
jgi:phosphate transport system ATP-binding protein